MNLFLLSEFDLAARTVAREALSGDYEDRRSIAHAFKNRLDSTTGQWAKDDTLASVVLRHMQFSVWTPEDVNFSKLYNVTYSSQYLREALQVVLEVFNGAEDITLGSRHYHTRAVSPPWSEGKTPCWETAGHLFFNDVN